MKKLLSLIMVVSPLVLAGAAQAQSSDSDRPAAEAKPSQQSAGGESSGGLKQDAKDGAHAVKRGAKEAGHGIKSGAKQAWSGVKSGSKRAWHSAKEGAHEFKTDVKHAFKGDSEKPAAKSASAAP